MNRKCSVCVRPVLSRFLAFGFGPCEPGPDDTTPEPRVFRSVSPGVWPDPARKFLVGSGLYQLWQLNVFESFLLNGKRTSGIRPFSPRSFVPGPGLCSHRLAAVGQRPCVARTFTSRLWLFKAGPFLVCSRPRVLRQFDFASSVCLHRLFLACFRLLSSRAASAGIGPCNLWLLLSAALLCLARELTFRVRDGALGVSAASP